jgi:hypothetical protein
MGHPDLYLTHRYKSQFVIPIFSQLESEIVSNYVHSRDIGGCIQKFPDWPPGARTANGTALCHSVQLYRYFVSQSSEFCRHNPLCWFSTSNIKAKRVFRYRLNLETFGYTLLCDLEYGNGRMEVAN